MPKPRACASAVEQVWLLKPTTFMNKSGIAVARALRYWKIEPEEMLVVHDDLDLPPGAVRLKYDGGHGGQNGLRDIFEHLGHGRFHRLRIGIGHPGDKDRVTPWVLGKPSVRGRGSDAGRDRARAGRIAAHRRRRFQRGDETAAHARRVRRQT